MNFVIDAMLGKLARWLRIMGHDVKYSIHFDDAELLSVVRVEKGVLLTRDLELYKQAITMGSEAYYVEGTTEPDRLAELAQRFNLPLEINLEKSRCPKCNAKIRLVNKKEIENRVEKILIYIMKYFGNAPNVKQSIGRVPIGQILLLL